MSDMPVVRCLYSRPSAEPTDRSVRQESPVDDSVDDLQGWYGVERPTVPGRPWVALNMVTSIDGSVAIDGASGRLGNATDRRILGALRAAAAIIVVGAGTARRESYGAPRKAGQRIAVVTNSGRLDATSPLFTSGAGMAITHERATVAPGIEVIRAGADEVDLAQALGQLGTRVPPGGWAVLEGGPSLNGGLLDLDLIDEVNVTSSPRLVGGGGPRMITGAQEADRSFELVHQLIDDEHYVFSRWVRRDRLGRRLS
jgi:riboflavin biosynthesis pyrimidine reductase